MQKKGQVSEFLKQYLADTRTDRVLPASAEVVRTDGAAEFRDGDFAQVCRDFGIRQEFTTRDRPEFHPYCNDRSSRFGCSDSGVANFLFRLQDSEGRFVMVASESLGMS